jgi:hypothetical protein
MYTYTLIYSHTLYAYIYIQIDPGKATRILADTAVQEAIRQKKAETSASAADAGSDNADNADNEGEGEGGAAGKQAFFVFQEAFASDAEFAAARNHAVGGAGAGADSIVDGVILGEEIIPAVKTAGFAGALKAWGLTQ